jgi:hypothetical protein
MGVIASENITEGRMVLLTSHSFDNDFGSNTDLPAVKLPDTSAEAIRARYCITFAVDNRPTPFVETIPSMAYALRGGFDQASNVPFSATVYLTHKANQEGLTIPSGTQALAFGEGIYTVPSGCYVYNASLTAPGAPLAVADTNSDSAEDAGKLKYSATNPVAEVIRYNSTDGKLTFKILH